MAWNNISMAEKVFAYFLFTVFEVILLSGIVGYCLGWSDAAAPIESDPDALTYTQMAKNCVNPPPPPPKSEEELEKEERMRALVPATYRAMVDKDSLSCFGGGSAATRSQQAMDMYRKPSLKGPPPPAPEPEITKSSEAPLKGPGSDSSDRSRCVRAFFSCTAICNRLNASKTPIPVLLPRFPSSEIRLFVHLPFCNRFSICALVLPLVLSSVPFLRRFPCRRYSSDHRRFSLGTHAP